MAGTVVDRFVEFGQVLVHGEERTKVGEVFTPHGMMFSPVGSMRITCAWQQTIRTGNKARYCICLMWYMDADVQPAS